MRIPARASAGGDAVATMMDNASNLDELQAAHEAFDTLSSQIKP